ncbi:LOW QUALITY PROTEIN: inhibitor of growth protein 4-like [Pollicipes pollicipes]|uniref:LOW QUALITY PROTEIN: inhibitor of growth protein 4-like n=1 Tax=Pollicipes pollicipes TaxID=41117 RepID=UPI00188578C8|nr:LOW QUALITY PROTEIN: inhibitor of growth protein 4-like [Pollicipes pollicipes]
MAQPIPLEHYLDSLESLPAELRRNFTLMRDLDERSHGLSRTLERESDEYRAAAGGLGPDGRRRLLAQVERLFTKLREFADDKVQLAIQTYELVDKHIRRLDSDLARFESEIKQKALGQRTGAAADEKKAVKRKADSTQRKRRGSDDDDDDDDDSPPQKKRAKKAAASQLALPITHPSDVLDMPVDPNEPTYCLCHQVSYGEMIGCDNLDCPIEWFHFACVGLSTKPKGKWFCPKCNQDRKKK